MKQDKIKVKSQSSRIFLRWGAALSIVILMVSCFTPQGAKLWSRLMVGTGLAPFTAELDPNNLHIHVLDVEKADAVLIESAEAAILVDTGTKETADDVLRYLSERQVAKLDAVWLSHSDSDHAGGLQTIVDDIEVKDVISRCGLHLYVYELSGRDDHQVRNRG